MQHVFYHNHYLKKKKKQVLSLREAREALKAIAHLSMPKHQCSGVLHSNRSHVHKMKPSGASPQTEPFIKTDSQMEVPDHQLLTHSL